MSPFPDNYVINKKVSGAGGSSGKALGYGLDGPGSIPGVGGVEIFLHSFVSRLALESTQPPIKWVPGNFPGDKRRPSVGLATLPHPSAVDVNMWTLVSTSSVGLQCLYNGDTSTFTYKKVNGYLHIVYNTSLYFPIIVNLWLLSAYFSCGKYTGWSDWEHTKWILRKRRTIAIYCSIWCRCILETWEFCPD